MSPYYILKIVHKELSVFIQLSCNLEGRHNKQLLTITRGITLYPSFCRGPSYNAYLVQNLA